MSRASQTPPPPTEAPEFVELLNARWPVIRPSFATIEEVTQAALAACNGVSTPGGLARFNRTYAAVLGICTQIGEKAGANWERSLCNPLVYGGQVYSYLREQGLTSDEIAPAAQPLVRWLLATAFPRKQEIKAKADFSRAGGDGSTPPASGSL